MKNNRNLIWLASYPKSGNTWFRVLLSNLLADSEAPININSLIDSPIASNRSIFDRFAGVNSSELSLDEINLLRPEVYKQFAKENQHDLYFKVHDAWLLNTDLEPIFPEDITKAVIYFIRHPLDVAISYSHHFAISVEEAIKELNDSNNSLCNSRNKLFYQLPQCLLSWSDHVISWIDKSNLPIHVIRYEDLLDDTYSTFSKALDFLGLSASNKQISRAVENSDFSILQNLEKRNGFKEKPIKSKSFFRSGNSSIKKDLNGTSYYDNLVKSHKAVMDRFNYLS